MTSRLCTYGVFAVGKLNYKIPLPKILGRNCVSYVQGQSPQPRIREYFYYIDHQGMLFLDDVRIRNFTSCFKERNFVRCDDLPLVFTKVIQKHNTETDTEEDWFSYAHADDLLTVRFEPQKLFMNISTGRVYHPAPEKVGGIGLVRSKLAIEFSTSFDFENGEANAPTHFKWKNKLHELDTEWYRDKLMHRVRQK
ncbi:UPF0598 protein CG30010 isoform X2 [Harpegnathos saltator]|uniref:UPF0598 protein CG30010 isoform X2 n=1 Tax=Harpegnathos saltator TaxID=610380 RepID=UPI00058D3C18|nr:UPF0598 protein CG30010 isoform X2 [Harpegnathos saltator]